jgi:phosphatidate cytidylyltransferase
VLRTRLLTAAIGLPVALAIVLWAPPHVFTAFIAVLTALALYELISMTQASGVEAALIVAIAVFWSAALLTFAYMDVGKVPAAIVFVSGLIMLVVMAQVARRGAENVPRDGWFLFAGALWVGGFFPYLAMTRNRPGGIAEIILIFLMVVASDSGAYFAGRMFGRHKLAPRVSPNKTIEGAIGGLAACVVAALILRPWLEPDWSWLAMALIAAGVSVLAQAGDLVNSAYKRVAGVKDSGWIFPGHGGLLDRVCGLLFAVAFAYYCTS